MLVPALALLLAAGTPAAKPPKESRFEQGQKLFTQGDFDAALKALDGAVVDGGDSATMEKVHLLRAQCFAARQDFVRAEEAFGQALEFNPDVTLDPARVDPTLVKLLEAVRARSVGQVLLNSTPPGADVSVDGKSLGPAPQSLSLSSGKHKVEAKWADGPAQKVDLLVRPRQQTRVEWVQQVSVAPGKATLSDRPLRPFGDLRGMFEPSTSGAVDGGLELGGGLEFLWFRLGLFARLYPLFSLTPRFQFSLPVATTGVGDFNITIEAGAPITFLPDGVGIGVQGAGGVEWYPLKWAGAYALIGGRHHFRWPGRNDVTAFTATAGVRLRMP
ncbi:MAG: tetratricopeptide repeat protein [Myxococcaceae bacterium]